MTLAELRQRYLDFFKERGHAVIPSASLIPENDPTTLFTGSGMQSIVPYLLGAKHPLGTRIADSQKCFRSQDIDEVGDNRHTTFFEMLGNWSLGDYFKREQIAWMFDFLTNQLALDPNRLYISVFRGHEKYGIPRDDDSVKIWQAAFASRGIAAQAVDLPEEKGMQGGRIFYYDENKNWWSRSGVPDNMPDGEPGGPDSEMFWDFGVDLKLHENSMWSDQPCHINCDCGRFVEVGNNVFMEYVKKGGGFEKLAKQNVDFGGGLERCLAACNDDPDVYKTDVLRTIVTGLEKLSGKQYADSPEAMRAFRIIADHLRAATFIIGDPRGVTPSNIGQGYVVRRLIRRAIREARRLGITAPFLLQTATAVIDLYSGHYTELKDNREHILNVMTLEEEKFTKTLEKGLKEFERMMADHLINGEEAFILFSSYGFPLELTQELVGERGGNLDVAAFTEEFKKHQELSRTASAGMFKGGLADASVETTRLHTATHLLQAALRQVLGSHVAQKGSNITVERLRFDFVHPQKMTADEIQRVEELVNQAIKHDLEVTRQEMSPQQAKEQGAIGLFEQKYGEKVSMYTVGNFSKEICGGPHVTHTGELGVFKIIKEEAVSSGVRRIKATLFA